MKDILRHEETVLRNEGVAENGNLGLCAGRSGNSWCPGCGRMNGLHKCFSESYGREVQHCGFCNYLRKD